jgi:hypothetical protein
MSAELEPTIKPVNLPGLRLLLDLDVKLGYIDMSEVDNFFLDAKIIVDLLNRNPNLKNIQLINKLLKRSMTKTLIQSEHIILKENIELLLAHDLDCKSPTINIIPGADEYFTLRKNVPKNNPREDLSIVDFYIWMCYLTDTKDVDLIECVIKKATNENNYKLQAFTINCLLCISDYFKFYLFDAIDSQVISDIEFFYVCVAHISDNIFSVGDIISHVNLKTLIGSISFVSFNKILYHIVYDFKLDLETQQTLIDCGFNRDDKLNLIIDEKTRFDGKPATIGNVLDLLDLYERFCHTVTVNEKYRFDYDDLDKNQVIFEIKTNILDENKNSNENSDEIRDTDE